MDYPKTAFGYGVYVRVEGEWEFAGFRKTESGAWAFAAKLLDRRLYGGTQRDFQTIEITDDRNRSEAKIVKSTFRVGDNRQIIKAHRLEREAARALRRK